MAAAALVLREGDRARLASLTGAPGIPTRISQRAEIILMAADGVTNTAIADRLGVTRKTVVKWRGHYERSGLTGLEDRPRQGRPREVDHDAIIAATLRPPPADLGVTHWSSRRLAAHLGIGSATVARAWHAAGVRPHGPGSFTFATSPELVARITDVAGLYLGPSGNAIVLRAEDDAGESAGPHRTGVAALLAALRSTSEGPVATPHQGSGLLDFLERVAHARPEAGGRLVLCVALEPEQAREIRVWAAAYPRIRVHVVPAHRWTGLAETWFGLIEGQAACREIRAACRGFVWVDQPPAPVAPPRPDHGEIVPIRTVADGFAIPFSTLHYWERQGLVTPHRLQGQRFYDAAQIRRIALVQLWRETGMLTIDDIATVLTEHERKNWHHTVRDRIDAINEQAERLNAARTYLSHLLTCTHEPLEECPDFRAMVASRVETWLK
ncbi:helix-turn-helix domain-containing protein [Spongiactinospora sp. 9N601]|uniref:helix-turn-helix domain-containing protein n=1 Tax=Spongiactinospora sp. 9N601 TaxID=3375149 RepID=UPI0037B3A9DD